MPTNRIFYSFLNQLMAKVFLTFEDSMLDLPGKNWFPAKFPLSRPFSIRHYKPFFSCKLCLIWFITRQNEDKISWSSCSFSTIFQSDLNQSFIIKSQLAQLISANYKKVKKLYFYRTPAWPGIEPIDILMS